MKKRIFLLLFLLPAILVLGGCGKKVDDNKAVSNIQNNAVVDKGEAENTKTIKSVNEIMASGKSLECTFSYTDEEQGVTESGSYYIDGPKARFRSEAEIIMKNSDQKTKAYMIGDGSYAYSWSDASGKTGFKISMKEESPSAENTGAKAQKDAELDRKMNFDCRDWSVDDSKFTLPPGIEFTNFSEMMKSLSAPVNK
ncbi:MAG: hypothetical protein ABIB72_04080 [Candidatus Falkowbacteria bacterium]